MKNIFQLLDNAGVSWKVYYSDVSRAGVPLTTLTNFVWGAQHTDAKHLAPVDCSNASTPCAQGQTDYFTDLNSGSFPSVVLIEPGFESGRDEHPGNPVQLGAVYDMKLIQALMGSQIWKDSVFFLSFDEAGGPYDHVPPVPGSTNKFTTPSMQSVEGDIAPIAVNPDAYGPCVPATPGVYTNHCDVRPGAPGAKQTDAPAVKGFAAQLGFRVPNLIISPFARRHYVGHRAMDHTAVLRFLENRYGLPALTKRDAAQPDLLDFFDFNAKPWLTPPAQSSVPIPPTVGGTCHSSNF